MEIKKLFEDEKIILVQDESGEYYLMQRVDITATKSQIVGASTEEILRAIDIPQRLNGFCLIVDAVDILIKEPQMEYKFLEKLYSRIGEKHNIPANRVDNLIRYAISYASKNETYKMIFQTYKQLGSKQFLVSLANYQKQIFSV